MNVTITRLCATCALALFVAGCSLQAPEDIAEAQFRAWAEGDDKAFSSYFTPDGAQARKNALLGRSDTVKATYQTTGETKPLMYFVQGDPYGVPMGLRMFPPETIGFSVISSTINGDQAVVEAALSYPDTREMMLAMFEATEARIDQEGAEAGVFDARFASEEEIAAYQDRFKALALKVFQEERERVARTQRVRYALERRWGRWKVVEEPVTASLLP